MSEKWTKGPWCVNGETVESTSGVCRSRIAIIDDGAGTNPTANAHLIAAAPDLYAALELIYGRLLMSDRDGWSRITAEDGEMAELALKKARGEG